MGKFSFSEHRGFSIVELLIVVGGLAGLALVSMSVTKMNTKSTAKFSQDSDIQGMVNELSADLANPAKCLASLGGSNAVASTNTITNISSKYYVASTTQGAGGYGNSNVRIDAYTVGATAAEVTANTSYLNIIFQNKNILVGESGITTVVKKIKLYVVVDGAKNITDCRSIATSTSDVWTRGTSNAIYYVAGNVGVGTTTPTERLEINGTLKTTDFQLTSDRQFKTEIQSLNKRVELDKILKLRPVAFTWKETGKRDQGFIAQEVKKEFPLLVEGHESEGRGLAIKYLSVISSVVSSLQEIFHRQEALEAKVDRQEKQIAKLMQMNLELQQKLEQK